MTWRIGITPEAICDGIAVQIARRYPDAGMVEVVTFERRSEIVDANVHPHGVPSLRLDDDLGRALLDALAEHYGNTSGGRQQRADYEHERKRVDRLIGALIDRGEPPAAPSGEASCR